MNKVLPIIQEIQKELNALNETKTLAQAQRVILCVIRLLDSSVSLDDSKQFQLFNVDNQKISANAQWFYEDNVVVDRRAIYKIHSENKLNVDFKLYGIVKPSKRTISWIQALTPNFEDEPFNSKFNIGIDFVVPKSADKVIIVLSNNYVVRTLELKGVLTATFQEILAKWASISDFSNKKEAHSILWESFDLQPLNKKFYAGISERFITLRQYLTKENILDEKHASLFANRLLGRVIFCWFLDKKGVINSDRKYFDSHSFTNDSEYYRKNLENLFFGVLNTPIQDREYKDDVTPFLNGGLFEARDTDLYRNSELAFPKNYFDDLFDFLSGYNFTTDESTSQFQQVAIDPEMLGRIFENLLAEITEETGEQARKAKGAFYTPREIVDYMCRESLREYLKTKIPEDQFRDQRFAQLIDAPDKDFQDQDHNWRRDWKPYKDAIIKALDDLKVLDPACGSGAFPIGMLQLLVRVYERLEPRFDTYKAKLRIVEKNIYGVDIEPMAIEISRLRAWLSIIVDEESDSKKIKPLPNLEFKFICANSLIDLDQSGATTFGDDPDLADKLREIRDSYFNTESLIKKKKLRADYGKLVNKGEGLFGESARSKQLKTYRPFDNEWTASFFNPDFMFGVKNFQVVIGNPPYVSHDKLTYKDDLQKYNTYSAFADLYCYFYERSLNILSDDGQVVFITSNSFIKADYGERLRGLIGQKCSVNKILNIEGSQVFEAAIVNVSVVQIFKNKFYASKTLVTNSSWDNGTFTDFIRDKGSFVDSHLFESTVWSLDDQETQALIRKILKSGKSLEDRDTFIRLGIATGSNEAFLVDKKTRDYLIDLDSKNIDIIKPVLRGRDIYRYYYDLPDQWLLLTKNGINVQKDYPTIYKHLDTFGDSFKNRGAQGESWWNLRACAFFDDFKKSKIVWIELSDSNRFALCDEEVYLLNSAYFLIPPQNISTKYLLGILNSTLMKFLLSKIAATSGMGTLRWINAYIKQFPIVEPTVKNRLLVLEIEKIVDQISAAIKNGDDVSGLEKKIDNLVFSIYEISKDEIGLIYEKNK